jgi:hypothetical protein
VVPSRTFTLEIGAYASLTEHTSTSRGLVSGFYFLMDQGIVRLTLRVLDLVKTNLLKTLLSAFMEKISISKKVSFFQGITLSSPYRNFVLEI